MKRGTAAARGECAVALILVFALCVMPGSAQSPRSSQETRSMAGVSMARATAGKEVFRQYCSSCHFTETTVQKIGPGLKDLYKRTFSNRRRVTDAALMRWIEAGGQDMPGFKESVKPEQIRALISYIKTL